MEFIIDRKTFQDAIQQTLGIVERSTATPILQNVLIQTVDEGDEIEVLATNREIGIRAKYDAVVKKTGKITIPAKKLLELIKELPQGDNIHFIGKGKSAIITSSKIVGKINGLSADDYPEIVKPDEYNSFAISPVLFSDMLRKVSYAACKDESRKNLSGIYLQKIQEDGKISIRMVATDGHRLAVIKAERDESDLPIPEKGVIIPAKGLAELRKISEDIEDDIYIGFAQGVCIAESGVAMLRIGLIDSDYPDIQRVIPDIDEEGTAAVVVSRIDLLHSLRRMAVYGLTCVLHISGGVINLKASDPELGEIKDEIEAEIPEGVDNTVKYNVRYLTDAIDAVSDEKVVMHIPGGMKGCLITGAEDQNCIAVVMPRRD